MNSCRGEVNISAARLGTLQLNFPQLPWHPQKEPMAEVLADGWLSLSGDGWMWRIPINIEDLRWLLSCLFIPHHNSIYHWNKSVAFTSCQNRIEYLAVLIPMFVAHIAVPAPIPASFLTTFLVESILRILPKLEVMAALISSRRCKTSCKYT